MSKKYDTKKMILMSLFMAIILIMAFTPNLGYIPLGVTRATIIHIPVIVGSIVLGPVAGAFLGFVFGVTSLINNTINPTVTSFCFSPFYTFMGINGGFLSLVICFVPRILVGIVPYYIVKLLKKINYNLSLILAGLLGSLTNTLLVMNMIFIFFKEEYSLAKEIAVDTLYNVILSVIAINGVPEAIVASILTLFFIKAINKIYNRG